MKNTDYYDKIIEKTVLKSTDFCGGDDYSMFKHEKSLHTHTTAYGLPHVRQVCFCKSKVSSEFTVDEIFDTAEKKSRHVLKVIAAWVDWRKYEHPASIKINGKTLFDRHLFLENVCSGWPTQYFDIPNEFLEKGNNAIEIENKSEGENTLLLERAEIQRMTDVEDFTVFFCPGFANAGNVFQIGLHLLKEHNEITLECSSNIEFLGRKGNIFKFKALAHSNSETVVFKEGGKTLNCKIEEIYPEKPDEIYVGFDGDDVRHDESGEMDRCLEYLNCTQMGNLIVFRPGQNRNCCVENSATPERWAKWFKSCKDNGINYQLNYSETTAKLEQNIYESENFKGWQQHEPYLVYQPMNQHRMPADLKEAENLEDLKQGYIRYLSNKTETTRKKASDKVHYGDPSMLSAYMRDADADGILCEPVSNSSLLYGTARGTGKEFGAHIPADWYIGYPHDENALTRFKTLAYLNYAYGGTSIYVESSAFKTNAFSRKDRDDKFCLELREIIRSFYRFACSDQRTGKAEVPLALIYGNNESMFWLPDDRAAEMPDHDNWDNRFWGKWKDTSHRWLWKAGEAWLPVFEAPDQDKDQSLTRMFTGTPHGSVDVALPDSDLSQYKAVAFTGWNTMNEKIYENLIEYVKGGGILFICGAHFNTSQNPEKEVKLLNDGKLAGLIGADIEGAGEIVYDKYRTGNMRNASCKKKSDFLYEHALGQGKVYYYNFIDYPSDFRLVREVKEILKSIGEEVSKDSPFAIEGAGSAFINFNVWDKKKIYMTNVNWLSAVSASLKIKSDGSEQEIKLKPGETKIFNI